MKGIKWQRGGEGLPRDVGQIYRLALPNLFFFHPSHHGRFYVFIFAIKLKLWGHPKKVVQRTFLNHVDCLEQKKFLQRNTRTKDHLCANFQYIWLSSKSWILDIKYAISTIKMQILNQFFRKKIHYIVVISVPSFHQPARSSSFFLAFCLQFYGTTFYG